MATIVNTQPSGGSDTSSGMGLMMAVVLLALVVGLFYYLFTNFGRFGSTATPQVSIPDQIDVNVSAPQQ